MNETYRAGLVYVQNQLAGIIYETDEGYCFRYYENYLNHTKALAVSLTLPLQKDTYKSKVLFPFFDGLIPEGWLLNIVIHKWKLDRNDRFGLLLCACRDCIGDVRIEPAEDNL